LRLEGMQFFAHHGDVPAERELGSRVYVDVELRADLSIAGTSDSLADTVDYVRCYELVRSIVHGKPLNLIETIAEQIAQSLLRETTADSVRVRVAKQPPIDAVLAQVAAEIERSRDGAPS